jgi:beta-lactamase regulating signal transducer with metallopeptidase domain
MMAMATRGLVLALAWFAAANAGASILSWIFATGLSSPRQREKSRLLLSIRLFPAVASIVFAGALFLPSHWVFEPRDANETLGLAWYAMALAGLSVLVRSSTRALQVLRIGRRLRIGERRSTVDMADVHVVDGLRGVSLAGVFRARILIGPSVARELSSAELEVAVAHELAHRQAFDNLARWATLCAPDFFGGSRASRRLEQDWHAAAESLADARAVRGDSVRAVHLASALVKVARLAAEGPAAPPVPAWSTLNDPPLLERRVRSLVTGAVPLATSGRSRVVPAVVTLGVSLLVAVPAFAGMVHRLTETLVNLLP